MKRAMCVILACLIAMAIFAGCDLFSPKPGNESQPESSALESSMPESSEESSGGNGGGGGEASKPESSKPAESSSKAEKPESKPSSSTPASSKPESSKPATPSSKPESSKPETPSSKPEASSSAPESSKVEEAGSVSSDFLMYVEDVFNITGRGLVVSGRITSGTVKVGQTATLVFNGSKVTRTVKIDGIEMFHKLLDSAEKGDNVGLLLSGVDKSEIERGTAIIGNGGFYKPVNRIFGVFQVYSKEEGGRSQPINTGYRPQLFVGPYDHTAEYIGNETLTPGSTYNNVGFAIANNRYAVAYPGQQIAVREGGRTVGLLTITNVSAE